MKVGGLALTWNDVGYVYSCLVPSSFIMNVLGVRFYFLAEKLGYRTCNLSRTNCISIQSLHVYVRINVS